MASRMAATESPTLGEGAALRSTAPKGNPSSFAASLPTSSPSLVILMAARLMASWRVLTSASGRFLTTASMTPGPLTAMFTTASGRPRPWYAPGMNGTSSGRLAVTAKRAAAWGLMARMISAAFLTASRLMPVMVEAVFRKPATLAVVFNASGSASMRALSPLEAPMCTNAERPPTMSTPYFSASLSRCRATSTAAAPSPMGSSKMETGDTASLTVTILTPSRDATRSTAGLSSFRCGSSTSSSAGSRSPGLGLAAGRVFTLSVMALMSSSLKRSISRT